MYSNTIFPFFKALIHIRYIIALDFTKSISFKYIMYINYIRVSHSSPWSPLPLSLPPSLLSLPHLPSASMSYMRMHIHMHTCIYVCVLSVSVKKKT